MLTRSRHARLLFVLLLAALLAFAAAGCGESEVDDIAEGEKVELGDLSYNVLFSRYLNPNDVEDQAYLVGQGPQPQDGIYFGVFLEIENTGDETQTLPALSEFVIHDSRDQEYMPLKSESLYALVGADELEGGEELPIEDSTARTGPVEGSLIIYALPYAATDLRPLKLVIPGEGGPAEIELDL
jgi:hypothetical protein